MFRDDEIQDRRIPIGLIDEPQLPARHRSLETKLDELVASIRQVGLLEPLIVVARADRYEVVAGHRRRIACGRAGLVHVPCRVFPDKGAALEAIKHAENRHRLDMTAAEEALYFADLLERDHGGDTDRLAAWLGETRAYVEGRLLLFQGDPLVFEALADERIKIGVAHELNKCTDELHRRMLLHNAIEGGATVALVSGWIQEWKTVHQPATQRPIVATEVASVGTSLSDPFFTCPCCGQNDNRHTMRGVMIHSYCEPAVLAPALKLWGRRHEVVAWPRTVDEARALINELADRFPTLLGEETTPA